MPHMKGLSGYFQSTVETGFFCPPRFTAKGAKKTDRQKTPICKKNDDATKTEAKTPIMQNTQMQKKNNKGK